MKSNKLIIFDVDGVLLNSEPLYMAMHRQWFAEIGVNLTEAKHQTLIGMAATKFWHYLKTENNLKGDIADYIAEEKARKFEALQAAELTPSEGLLALLNSIQAHRLPIGIASSGLRKNIDLILAKLGIASFFDHIVSGEQVTRGKPEPDIFLQVAEHFNIEPQHCLVIEDSTNGVQGAKAAQMFCVGYFNPTSGQQDLSKADLVIDHLADARLRALWENL